jgi:hypothetical protein
MVGTVDILGLSQRSVLFTSPLCHLEGEFILQPRAKIAKKSSLNSIHSIHPDMRGKKRIIYMKRHDQTTNH